MTASSGLLRLPELLDPEREDLRVRRARRPATAHPGLRERAARALGERRHLRGEVGRRLRSRRPGVPSRVEARRRRAHADARARPRRAATSRGEAGEQVDAELLGLLAEPAHDLADRGDVVAVVLHRRRRRDARARAPLGQQVDALARPPARGTGSPRPSARGTARGTRAG